MMVHPGLRPDLGIWTIRLDDEGKGSAQRMMMRARKRTVDDDEGEEAHGG